MWETALPGKGALPKELHLPNVFSGTYAEYAADCHTSGALSEYKNWEEMIMP